MTNFTSFLNSKKIGDILYAIPGMRNACLKRGTKARLYLRLNVSAINTTDGIKNIQEIMLTDEGYAHLRPLLMAQDFIEDVREYSGEPIDFNLDNMANHKIGMPHGSIMRWPSYVYPEMNGSYDDVWLNFTPDANASDDAKDKIVVSFSHNYRNPWINYEFLNIFYTEYPILFIGHEDEAQEFVNKVPRTQWLKCDNFNEIANALSSCKVFIGNQSAVFAVAEGLKIPRILEICVWCNNVIPQGKGGMDFYNQQGLEWFLKSSLR